MNDLSNVEKREFKEFKAKSKNGMSILLLNIVLMVLDIIGIVFMLSGEPNAFKIGVAVLLFLYLFVVAPIIFFGLKVVKPNEALVLSLFGKYYGSIREDGFYFVNPFATAISPPADTEEGGRNVSKGVYIPSKRISLKAMTLNNDKQKINDQLGNPIIIGIVVIWRVVNTANAVFNVDNYKEFLTTQCDSALRNIVRLYPYDTADVNDNEKSLRGSSQEIAQKLKEEIQSKVDIAGLEIMEARITHLSYSQEIAAAMLQRQQAAAIIDARQMIVEGAVGMVEIALEKLNENNVVDLDEERKAAMVSNLLVVLCGSKDAQPIVNSGSIY
ncbi:SPFH domain-containing protein [Metaclostridioides mangenotii]|jgi:regulator of protease activity HflC (stomatin/prohibitin superfamily)|uniref:Regulator of protease activity HflC (Stomatin/prohibitin superfamily) n=1 Tax=Metaclostridioides mangenotii TaxID=1540 RepID=A0ABS4EC71_9FIRM|nr:SPFH domain-containing protein [Clostridioides mangenotii]MBP1855542.1 regulator of protease activity HflC (stomatin/prohibitin superfamily) [Clostridioides mangenotii]